MKSERKDFDIQLMLNEHHRCGTYLGSVIKDKLLNEVPELKNQTFDTIESIITAYKKIADIKILSLSSELIAALNSYDAIKKLNNISMDAKKTVQDYEAEFKKSETQAALNSNPDKQVDLFVQRIRFCIAKKPEEELDKIFLERADAAKKGHKLFKNKAGKDAYIDALRDWVKWIDTNLGRNEATLLKIALANHIYTNEKESGHYLGAERNVLRSSTHSAKTTHMGTAQGILSKGLYRTDFSYFNDLDNLKRKEARNAAGRETGVKFTKPKK